MKRIKKITLLLMITMLFGVLYCCPAFAASNYKNLTGLQYSESYKAFDSGNYNSVSKGIITPSGKEYIDNIMYFDASYDAYVSYNLNKKYGILKGTIVTSTRTGSGSFTVTFYGDGKKLKSYSEISNTNQGINFSIDVTNVKKLKITTSNQGSFAYGWVFLVNTKVSQPKLTLSNTSLTMNQNENTYVTWTFTNAKGATSVPSASWKSSNTKVAKVSSKGKVVAVGAGTCKLTCKTNGISKTVTVVVKPKKVSSVGTLSKTKTSVQLKWASQNGVTAYQIYMYDPDLEEYTRVKTVKSSVLSAKITGLKKGTTYKFKIRAYLKADSKTYYGSFSKVYSVKTKS